MAHDHRITSGSPEPLGVTADAGGINVAVASGSAQAILFCLFDAAGEREIARIPLPERTGDVFHGHVAGVRPGARYGLRAHGPFAPREGHRFNAHKLLIDPHARLLDRPALLHPSMFGYRPGDRDADLSFDDTDSAPFVPKAIVMPEAMPAARPPARPSPWRDTVLYELHVKGFTAAHPAIAPELRGRFAALGQSAVIEHLRRLGVTSVELMPVAAKLDERHLGPLGLTNYWGYNPLVFGAPEPRLAPGGWAEIRAAVAALADGGIETILDVVFNHGAEGDHLGPTVSLRGLDNAGYYRLVDGDARRYVDDAGCGNVLALERPIALRLVLDSLRAWATLTGIAGFRFDLATTLGRGPGGFDRAHPLLQAIAQDPLLRGMKLIAEPWDVGPGGYQLGAFPAGWGEWNDRFRDATRRFWRGDGGMLGEMATRFAGSADVFAPRARPLSRSVNHVTAHDGFTAADLVAYARKHNAANGEDGRDGTDANHSWNNGVEGTSDSPTVRAARARDVRALLATLIFSRGTPMLSMGDELGRTQHGNNNAYAQDGPVSWVDWSRADRDLAARVAAMLAARHAHPALRGEAKLLGAPIAPDGERDVVWLRPDGEEMGEGDWGAPEARTLICVLHDAPTGDRVILILAAGREAVVVQLPNPGESHAWRVEIDTDTEDGRVGTLAGDRIAVAPRSVLLLAAVRAPARRGSGVDPALLHRLAGAAGIATQWWDLSGLRHVPPPPTLIAILASMRLPASTRADALASLARLEQERVARPLPHAAIGRPGEAQAIDVATMHGTRTWLTLRLEDGATRRIALDPDRAPRHRLELGDLPAGLHRIFLDDRPEIACALTVAPLAAWMPPALREHRALALSAHLPTLRRSGDQGIGDFTTLGVLAREAAAAGFTMIGLNPLHALFATDPSRASPYQPTDRRFLEPLLVDVAVLGDLVDAPEVRRALELAAPVFRALSEAVAIDHEHVARLKAAMIEAAFAAVERQGGAVAAEFAAFVEEGGEALHAFAAFETLAAERHGEPWTRWPEALRRPDAAGVKALIAAAPRALRLSLFRQFLAARGLAAAAGKARRDGLKLGFYRDLAVGAAPDGAEAWACQDLLAHGVSIGAPPDPFSADGQVWGLPPPDPLALARVAHRPFGELLAANMRHAGALRIDHVMGLTRLFWVPEGARPADGTYVGGDLEAHLAHVALASHRARCAVVGEDLGTVPDGLRARLAAANVLSYKVLWFERDGVGFTPPSGYPPMSTACVGTHDLPPLAGWWVGADIAERVALGLLDGAGEAAAWAARDDEKRALISALEAAGLVVGDVARDGPIDDALAAAIHAYAARAPSRLFLVQADDLAGTEIGVNLPGTDRERPNWRLRPPVAVEDLLRTARARAIRAALADDGSRPRS